MHIIFIFTTAFLVGLSGAMAPGPVTIVLIHQTLKKGFRAAPLIALGHGLLELLMLSILLFGLGSLLTEKVAALMALLGGGMLLWMGQAMIRHPLGEVMMDEGKKRGDRSPLLEGALGTISNPYWFLWWSTIGLAYMNLSWEHGIRGVLFFFTGHILADLLWLSFLALALVTGKRFISRRIYQRLMRCLGFFLLLFAIFFVIKGVGMF